MKMKYCIGFFAAVFMLVSLIGIGYQLSYKYAMDKQEARVEKQEEQKESVTTKGSAEKNEGYFLKELQGYVAVYLSDKTTIYEFTNIPVLDLPEELQNEIREEKHIETEEELYAFLENYSS